jgi:UDP-N-acetylmuramoylalanine--D-glutamate ligase
MLFKNKRVTVMGLGSFGGGIGVATFLAERGARVTVTDMKTEKDLSKSLEALRGHDIRFVLGGHHREDFTGADMVVASPAVPRDSQFIAAARAAGVKLHTEIGLFVERCPAPVCGVTGSNGKTTTVSMLGAILAQSGLPHHVGGNIGKSLLAALPEMIPEERVVLELSSFQIEWLDELGWSPRIAAILNIMPNHLDRHGTFEEYANAKGKLLDHQQPDDTVILNADNPGSKAMERRVRGNILWFGSDLSGDGITLGDGWIICRKEGIPDRIFATDHLLIPGRHNIQNALAAVACALSLGVDPESISRGIGSFRGVPHRLELAGEIEGVKYYNDSKATTPEAATVGIGAFEGRRILPILGGYDKGVSFDLMAREIAGKVRWAALIGVTAPRIRQSLDAAGVESTIYSSFEEAFTACAERARSGDVVLLSPGCASYDMFNNYEERGERFRELVRAKIPE